MVETTGSTPRSLRVHYSAWLGQTEPQVTSALQSGLIVPDSNVLLSLYEVGAAARSEMLGVFGAAADRLWIPHQVAIEFSRNRKRVVAARVSTFTAARRNATKAVTDAIRPLEKAVTAIVELREQNRTSRQWDPKAAGVSSEAFQQRLIGILDPALEELKALEAEHDLGMADMQKVDAVYESIDKLLAGRIGDPVGSRELRALVDEALLFRYPNDIPPGGSDASKGDPLRASGDYLLWWEVMRRAKVLNEGDELVLVTSDSKADWWTLDDNQKPLGPRPELAQELHDACGVKLAVLSLAEFLDKAGKLFRVAVSPDTVEQVRSIEASVDVGTRGELRVAGGGAVAVNMASLQGEQLQALVEQLFEKIGYTIVARDYQGFDFVGRAPEHFDRGLEAFDVKRFYAAMPPSSMREFAQKVAASSAERGIFVTTSRISSGARSIAQQYDYIDIIDGDELAELLLNYLRLNFRFDNGRKAFDGKSSGN